MTNFEEEQTDESTNLKRGNFYIKSFAPGEGRRTLPDTPGTKRHHLGSFLEHE